MTSVTVLAAAKDWDRATLKLEKIEELTLDLNLYPRENVNSDVVSNYARAMEAGAEFPAVKIGLFNGEKIIVDGAHRTYARKRLKVDFIDCCELPFSSAAELFAEAVRLNAMHGKSFSDFDLKKSIKNLQRFKFNVKDIQSLLHVPAKEIQKVSAAPITTVRTPWGEKRTFTSPAPKVPDADSVVDLIKFKNALQFCISYAESRKTPIDELLIKELVVRARSVLGRLQFS